MNKDLMFSSATCEWATPPELFLALDAEFGFTCDLCATADNAKCKEFYSPEQDGLAQEWTGVCWCNPPYGREIGKWVRKAAESRCTVVMLLPARTDTKWFHDYIYGKAEIRFIKGRLKFGDAKNSAPFPSMVVIFKRESEKGKMAEHIDREAFKKSVEERYCKPCKAEGKDHNGCWCRACWVDDMLDEVDCFQPSDVAPEGWISVKDKLPEPETGEKLTSAVRALVEKIGGTL